MPGINYDPQFSHFQDDLRRIDHEGRSVHDRNIYGGNLHRQSAGPAEAGLRKAPGNGTRSRSNNKG